MPPPPPLTLLPAPAGGVDFGCVPEVRHWADRRLLCRAGAIRLQYGTVAYGYRHVSLKHSGKIAHYYRDLDPLGFIFSVARSFQKIIRQRDGSLFLLKFNGVVKSAVVAEFCSGGEEYYRVITAYPLERLPDWGKRNASIIWER